MGYMVTMGYCAGCKRLFSFNAHRVPSSLSTVSGSSSARIAWIA